MKWTPILAAACLFATPAFAQGGGRGFAAMDTNGDGQVTRAEAEAGRVAQFTRLDADRNGALSEGERNAAGRAAQAISRADTNGDGSVSRAEIMAQPYRLFDRLDTDDNDVLSTAELEAARQQRLNGGN